MAWTTPRTWVASEVVTAAMLNAHVRDNLNAINGYVLKAADESVTSSATLQNDDHLSYSIGAAGTYLFDLFLLASSAANAAGDLAVGFSFPTGTLHGIADGPDTALASGAVSTGNYGALLSMTSGVTFMSFGLSTTLVGIKIHGILIASATGALQVMWAQNASNGSASTIKAGSHMTVRQVA